MSNTSIHQYKCSPGFTTEVLPPFAILILQESRGKPQLLGALRAGLEVCCGIGMNEPGQCDMAIFTPPDAGKADCHNSQSVHLTTARHDLQNSGRVEYVTGREW